MESSDGLVDVAQLKYLLALARLILVDRRQHFQGPYSGISNVSLNPLKKSFCLRAIVILFLCYLKQISNTAHLYMFCKKLSLIVMFNYQVSVIFF